MRTPTWRFIGILFLCTVLVIGQTTYTISVSAEDGQDVSGTWSNNGVTISAGLAGANIVHLATRFTAIDTTAGLVVTLATYRLNFESSNGTATNFHAKILADDVDDCAALSGTHEPSAGWTDTAATLDYDPSSYPSADTYVDFTITSIIQEILDRAGWATGNDICVALKDDTSGANTSMAFESVDNGETDEPELVLTLTSGSRRRQAIVSFFRPYGDGIPVTRVYRTSGGYRGPRQ